MLDLKRCFIIILVILTIYFIAHAKTVEGMVGSSGVRCPNLLIQKGDKFYLHNTKLAKVPGVNPIMFNNLSEYTQFIEWQRAAGIRCPVLFLQKSYNAQGNGVFTVRPSTTDLQGGLPPAIPPAIPSQTADGAVVYTKDNETSLASWPLLDRAIGKPATVDATTKPEHESNMLYSASAMDDNWGGVKYTQKMVDKGAFEGDEVYKIGFPGP